MLRRAGWGVVTASRGDALPGVWEQLGVNRSAYRLAPTTAGEPEVGALGGVA